MSDCVFSPHLLLLLLCEIPWLNQLRGSHTLKLLVRARGHLENLTQHLALLLTLDLELNQESENFIDLTCCLRQKLKRNWKKKMI